MSTCKLLYYQIHKQIQFKFSIKCYYIWFD